MSELQRCSVCWQNDNKKKKKKKNQSGKQYTPRYSSTLMDIHAELVLNKGWLRSSHDYGQMISHWLS